MARYLNSLLRIKENDMNKKNLLRMTICFFSGWMGLEAAAQEVWDVDRCMNYAYSTIVPSGSGNWKQTMQGWIA